MKRCVLPSHNGAYQDCTGETACCRSPLISGPVPRPEPASPLEAAFRSTEGSFIEAMQEDVNRKIYGSRTGEVRVVDPNTGGEKGSKPVQFMRLLEMAPSAFLTDLGKLYEFGAAKYARDNWRKGYAWSLSYNALLRHLTATLNGEWADPESGLPHVVHVAWHCATLHTFMAEGLGTDDRL